MYHQPINLLYHPQLESISLYNYDIHVNYVDQLGSMTVEFPHLHKNDYEIYYVQEGTLTILVADKVVEIPANQFVFLSPGVKHGSIYTPNIEKKYLVIVFNIEKKNTVSPNNNLSLSEENLLTMLLNYRQNHSYVISADSYCSYEYIDSMVDEVINKNLGWAFMLRSHYVNFIISVLRNFIISSDVARISQQTNLPIAITKYLHANYQHNISLQDIADEFHITSRHANRLFSEYFGTSLSKTLTLYRLSYAKNYLIDTSYSVERIAENVGFSSASTLSKLFKENEGMTITQYRSLIHPANMG